VAGALLLMAVACRERAPTVQFDPGPVPSELAGGERRFNANCARCHGLLAAGSDVGPPLVHRYYDPNHHADEAFQRAVRFGVQAHHWGYGSMPSVEGVAPAEVDAITAYVRWLQRRAGVY
jgi:mono/diheme cytochrome c family protein